MHYLTTVVTVAFALALPALAGASSPHVTASARPDTVEVGGHFQYVVEAVVRGNEDIRFLEGPELSDFERIGQQKIPQLIRINGVTQRRLTVSYSLRATTTGKFSIAPPVLEIGGERMRPRPVEVEVVPAGKANRAPRTRDSRYFVEATVEPRRNPYVGEQILLTYDLFVDGVRLDVSSQPPSEPSLDAFWIEDLSEKMRGNRQMVSVNGRLMQKTTLGSYALFPLRAGEAVIDSMQVDLVLGSFFHRGRQVSVASDPIELEVQPLPPNAPPGFYEGNVGQWNFEVTADPSGARVGKPLTVRVGVNGTGQIGRVELPELPSVEHARVSNRVEDTRKGFKNLRVYGEKIATFTLTPLREGPLRIPEMEFSYFDPDEERYVTLRSKPITVEVGPGELPPEPVAEQALVRREGSTGGDLVLSLRERLRAPWAHVTPGGAADSREQSPLFWVFSVFPLLGLCYLAFERRLRALLARREPQLARKSASNEALEQLAQAESAADPASAIVRAIRTYAHGALGVPHGRITQAELPAALRERKVASAQATELGAILGVCASARYSPGGIEQDPRELIARARAAIDAIEKDPGVDRRAVAAATILSFLLVLGAPFLTEAGGDASEALARAHTATSSEDWTAAADAWQQVAAEHPDDPAVLYNLGTTLAHAGKYARARLALERASLRMPFHGDVDANLDIVSQIIRLRSIEASRTGTTVEGDEALFWWRIATHVTGLLLGLLMLLGWWSAFGVFFLRRRGARDALRDALVVLGVLALTLAVSASAASVARASILERIQPVVLIDDKLELREGPSAMAKLQRTPPSVIPGTLVRAVDDRGPWLKIALPDGTSGWLPRQSVGLVD